MGRPLRILAVDLISSCMRILGLMSPGEYPSATEIEACLLALRLLIPKQEPLRPTDLIDLPRAQLLALRYRLAMESAAELGCGYEATERLWKRSQALAALLERWEVPA